MSTVARDVLEQLLAYWERKRAGRVAPARGDIDPVEIPRLLRHLILIDVEYDGNDEPVDFCYRLWGEYVIDNNRRSLAGRRLSDLCAIDRRHHRWMENYCRAARGRRPVFDAMTYVTAGGTHKTMDVVILPLSSDGTRIDALMMGVLYREKPDLSVPEVQPSAAAPWAQA